jgi:FlaA1/EpsC-like NDP-sugar epimerase
MIFMQGASLRGTAAPPVGPRQRLGYGAGPWRQWLLLGPHLLVLPLAYWFAFAIRFDASIPERYLQLFWDTLPYLLAIRLFCLAAFGLHRGWPRHVGIHDLTALLLAISLSSVLFVLALLLTRHASQVPRGILILDWTVAVLFCGGGLFLIRLLRELRSSWLQLPVGRRTLIIGAGDAAASLLHELRTGASVGIQPIGLVDNNPAKRRVRIHGVPVLGSIAELRELVVQHRIRLLVIAIPSATRGEVQAIVERCVATGVEFKIVPSLGDLLNGHARLGQLRNVEVEDLLGRRAVELDLSSVRSELAGKVVLVTGGAGSIGSELARQLAQLAPARLLLLDKAESPLYFTHLEISTAHPELEVVPVIADVTNRDRLAQVFAAYRPAYVFHAAAYKHVPLMEIHLEEAVRNNVIGTLQVADCAVRHGTEQFILISTDKAVRPSSIMGATKRIAERVILGLPTLHASATGFRAVRFGNVLGSNGSVIPLFRRQISAGGPVTITHPEVTRYFMTIPEAVRLVLRAAVQREAAGRICLLEMGEQVGIVDLAENLIRLSGLEPYRDIPIIFTGMRPGEKLHEELISDLEETVPTRVEKLCVIQSDERDGLLIEAGVEQLVGALSRFDRPELLAAIQLLVPECVEPLRSKLGATAPRPPKPPRAVTQVGLGPTVP